jgi:hypothetical protein
MKTYWSTTRANGEPVEPGTVCLVSDPEDGTHPIYTYGKDQEEVLHKVSLNNMHAQAALQRRIQTAPPAAAPRAEVPAPMSAGEIMEAMAQRDNPATAGAATARLIADHTGVDLNRLAMNEFIRLATEWEQETPEFFSHPGNKTLLARVRSASSGTPTKQPRNVS